MTILDWFDILFDGIKRGIFFLESVDLGGISLADYIVVVFITSLVITLFLNVVLTGGIMAVNAAGRITKERRSARLARERSSRRKGN